MKPIDRSAYAIVRTFIAAGAAAWDWWNANGGGAWPDTDPSGKYLSGVIFTYVPRMTVYLPPEEDNCPSEAERADDAACFAMRYDVIFNPENRVRLIEALNAAAPAEVRAAFAGAPEDGGDLEWWATALAAGALIAIGGLPFAGAVVAKIAGYILAAWVAYGFIVPQTEGGKSLAEKYADSLKSGFSGLFAGAAMLGKLALGAGALYLAFKLLGGRR